MPYGEVELGGFTPGLTLLGQPDRVPQGGLIDALNVVPEEGGTISRRNGLARWAVCGRRHELFAFHRVNYDSQVLAGISDDANPNYVEVWEQGGGSSASYSTYPTVYPGPHFFTRFGGPTEELVFIANGQQQLGTWNGTAFALTPAFAGKTPNGRYVAVTPWDNRLVNARFQNAVQGDNVSSVNFSEAGDPFTFSTTWFEDVTPGDGEPITGMAVWRNYLFVFKRTKFFRFYGTTIDSEGAPTFEYTPIDTGIGCVAEKGIAVMDDGVYFVAANGIYKTNGGEPVEVSRPIQPAFSGSVPIYFTGGKTAPSSLQDSGLYDIGRGLLLFSASMEGSTLRTGTFVLNTNTGAWTYWGIGVNAALYPQFKSTPDFPPLLAVQDYGQISKYTEDANGDFDGADYQGFDYRARFAWTDLNRPNMKTVRQVKVWGTGELDAKLTKDWEPSSSRDFLTLDFQSDRIDTWKDGTDPDDVWGDGSDPTDVWGAGAWSFPRYLKMGARGTVFSIMVAGTTTTGVATDSPDAPWTIHRFTYHVREQFSPSKTEVHG